MRSRLAAAGLSLVLLCLLYFLHVADSVARQCIVAGSPIRLSLVKSEADLGDIARFTIDSFFGIGCDGSERRSFFHARMLNELEIRYRQELYERFDQQRIYEYFQDRLNEKQQQQQQQHSSEHKATTNKLTPPPPPLLLSKISKSSASGNVGARGVMIKGEDEESGRLVAFAEMSMTTLGSDLFSCR